VEVSLFEALAEWMGQPAYYTRYGGTQPPRMGTQHATIAPYGAYAAADGKQVLFSIQNEREWVALCRRFLQRPELVDDPRFTTGSDRVVHRGELNEIVAERFRHSDSAEAMKLLSEAGIANAGVNDVREFLEHPVLAERGRWHEVGIPGAVVQALRPPVDLVGIGPRMDPVPAVGEHTERILSELGTTAAELEALRANGVI
jgi:formyl-CoA transferase